MGAVASTARRAPIPPLPPESVPSLPPERPPAVPSPDGHDPAPHHPSSQAWLVQCATTFRQDPDPWRQRFADVLEGALGDGHTSGCEVTADVAIGADVPRREANTTLPFYDEQGLPTFGCAFELPTPPNRAWTAAPLTGIEGVCVINVVELRRALRGHQNREFVDWLLQGCVDGFDLLIEAEENGPVVHPNKVLELPAHREHLHKEFAAERAAGRYAKVDPNCHPHLQVQSQGVVSKKSYELGVLKWRTVINLSACSASQDSINSGIQDLALAFIKHHEIMAEMVRRGPQATACVADLRHAYRQLKVHPSLFHLLGLQLGGVTVVDTSPGFGSRSAPWIFQNFMYAIVWILQTATDRAFGHGTVKWFTYLDDVGAVCDDDEIGRQCFALMMSTLQGLNILLAEEKCAGPVRRLPWLGLYMAIDLGLYGLPEDKVEAYGRTAHALAKEGSSSRTSMESAAGRFNFATMVWKSLKVFLAELYRLACGLSRGCHRHTHTQRLRDDMAVVQVIIQGAPMAEMGALDAIRQATDVEWPVGPGEAPEDTKIIWCCGDASGLVSSPEEKHGYGFFTPDYHSHSEWRPGDRLDIDTMGETSSVYCETVCMARCVYSIIQSYETRGKTIEYWTDCQGVLQCHERGMSSSRIANDVLRGLTLATLVAGCRLVVRWTRRESPWAQYADQLSHCNSQMLCHSKPASSSFRTHSSLPPATGGSLNFALRSLKRHYAATPPRATCA